MARVSTGIDIGSSTVKLISGEFKGTGFVATSFVVAQNPQSGDTRFAVQSRHSVNPAQWFSSVAQSPRSQRQVVPLHVPSFGALEAPVRQVLLEVQ